MQYGVMVLRLSVTRPYSLRDEAEVQLIKDGICVGTTYLSCRYIPMLSRSLETSFALANPPSCLVCHHTCANVNCCASVSLKAQTASSFHASLAIRCWQFNVPASIVASFGTKTCTPSEKATLQTSHISCFRQT